MLSTVSYKFFFDGSALKLGVEMCLLSWTILIVPVSRKTPDQ